MKEEQLNGVDCRSLFAIRTAEEFEQRALAVFRFQAQRCAPYRAYIRLLGMDPASVDSLSAIPFFPVSFFKSQRIYGAEGEPEKVFTSSSTSGQTPAKHYVADLKIYETAFARAFELFYGPIGEVSVFALLPNYLEREGSSLVYMVDWLIRNGAGGGFYLYDHEALLRDMEACQGKKILLGVSYALWDLAEAHPTQLTDTVVMETGGMKGHREELPREAFHQLLCEAFGVGAIHSEYGMAELLSQGYSSGAGIFRTPPWMQVRIRSLNDPFEPLPDGQTGGVNIVDLANLYSCSFLQTEDLGVVLADGAFRISGRISGSEVRGCNLLVQ